MSTSNLFLHSLCDHLHALVETDFDLTLRELLKANAPTSPRCLHGGRENDVPGCEDLGRRSLANHRFDLFLKLYELHNPVI